MRPFLYGGILVLGLIAVYLWSRARSRGPNSGSADLKGASIYSFVSKNIDPISGSLRADAGELPDENRRSKDGGLRWIAGGLDGAMGHHAGAGKDDAIPEKVASLVLRIANGDNTEPGAELLQILQNNDTLTFLDSAIDKMIEKEVPLTSTLRNYARSLVMNSPDREPVKFGVSLLGLVRDPSNKELLTTIGLHEEFTLFAAVALKNSMKEPDEALFELAKRVHGWGRIQIVERLRETRSTEIKRWLVREGFKNQVMNEYLAYICAVSGDLHHELAAEKVDEGFLDSAGDLLRALIAGGPAQDISDYEHAATVCERYLHHISSRPSRISCFQTAALIADYVGAKDWDESAREKNGWNQENLRAVKNLAESYISRRDWNSIVETDLQSEDSLRFSEAEFAAKRLGIDTWDTHWQRVQEKPDEASRWYSIMALANYERIDTILNFASEALPLEKIRSGPSMALGLGPEFKAHSCLDSILQDLSHFPGKGRVLIETGLKSPVIRNRNMAINALSTWKVENIDDTLLAELKEAIDREPSPEVKERLQKQLSRFGM